MGFVESSRAFFQSRWGAALKLLLGLGVLVIVVRSVEWSVLSSLASRTSPIGVLLVALSAIGAHVVGAARFKLLCDPVVRLPLLTHARLYFVSTCFGLFLPSLVGGDSARVVMLVQSGAKASQATTLVLSERIIGVASLLLVSASAALFSPLPAWAKGGLGAAALLALLALEIMRRVGATLKPGQAWAQSALDAVARALSVERVGSVLLVSLFYQTAAVATTAFVGWGLALDVPKILVFTLTPLVWFATMLPISVGGLGVREAGFLIVFSWAGVEREPALLLSLGTYAGVVIVGLCGAIWFALARFGGRPAPLSSSHTP